MTYLCNVTSDPTMVGWVPLGGVDVIRATNRMGIGWGEETQLHYRKDCNTLIEQSP